ncbi:MAG: hypothetical protein Aurels2KO_36910 [Aureliella sp.]
MLTTSSRALLLLTLCIPLLIAHIVTAQSPGEATTAAESEQALEEQVKALVEQMMGSDLEQRDAAEKRIVDLGPEAAEFLPEVTDNTSGEMKIRLQRIATAIGNGAQPGASDVAASRCSLSGKMSLDSALEKIREQTDNSVEIQGGDMTTRQLDLDLDDVTFWEAISEIMKQANLALVPFSAAEDALVLRPAGVEVGDPEVEPYLSGPFRVDPLSVRAQRTFTPGSPAQLEVNCNVSWEPKLKPTALTIPMANVVAIASGDMQLQTTNPTARPTVALNSGGATTTITLLLSGTNREVPKLDSLTGELIFAIPGAVQKFEFDKLNSGARKTKKNAGVSVTLASFARNQRTYEARVLVVVEDAASVRRMLQSQEGYLVDSKDVRIENVGDFEFPGVAGSAGLAYLFGIRGDPADYKFVFEMPGGFSEARTTYQLKDIPLP